ncbi:MAG: lytic transglycosylase domain-containing protein [Nocardioides sp.]
MTARFGKAQKAAALVPLAALSAAWTISLTGLGAGSAEASGSPTNGSGGILVPADEIADAASIGSGMGGGTDVAPGLGQQMIQTADSSGIPAAALAAYQRAASVIDKADPACHLSWQLIGAIGRVESNHGRADGNTLSAQGVATPGILGPVLDGSAGTSEIADTDAGAYDGNTSFDRAVGPMQFIPSTWAVVGVDADGDGQRNPQDIDDAALATAVYLCSGSGDLSTMAGEERAVYRYNHSQSYVDTVLGVANAYLAGDYSSVPNYTVPAAYLTPSTSMGGGRHHAVTKHHKPVTTRTTATGSTAPSEAPAAPAGGSTSAPAPKPTKSADPAEPVKQAIEQPVKAVTDTVASVAQLTQVCTQAFAATTAQEPASALTTCVNELTGKTLPQAQKSVTGVVSGLAGAVTGIVGGLLGGAK